MADSESEHKVIGEERERCLKQSDIELWETATEEKYDRIMQWFENMGVHQGSPEEIICDEEDKHKREASLHNLTHVNNSLCRRIKNGNGLHINLDFKHINTLELTHK